MIAPSAMFRRTIATLKRITINENDSNGQNANVHATSKRISPKTRAVINVYWLCPVLNSKISLQEIKKIIKKIERATAKEILEFLRIRKIDKKQKGKTAIINGLLKGILPRKSSCCLLSCFLLSIFCLKNSRK